MAHGGKDAWLGDWRGVIHANHDRGFGLLHGNLLRQEDPVRQGAVVGAGDELLLKLLEPHRVLELAAEGHQGAVAELGSGELGVRSGCSNASASDGDGDPTKLHEVCAHACSCCL